MEKFIDQYVQEVYKNGELWLRARLDDYTYEDHTYWTLAEES